MSMSMCARLAGNPAMSAPRFTRPVRPIKGRAAVRSTIRCERYLRAGRPRAGDMAGGTCRRPDLRRSLVDRRLTPGRTQWRPVSDGARTASERRIDRSLVELDDV